MSDNKTPRVGIGCWIFNQAGQVLLGLRLSPHGHDTWAAPGGKLEPGEEPADCAARELSEETGIIIPPEKFQFICFTNDIYPDAHYITLHYRVNNVTAVPHPMEPTKCAEWKWFDLNNLPNPLLLSAQKFIKLLPHR
ncbi:MAG: NUDIX domain-containing protein [Alphaproteobacteria bacterium]|nr:NUDIX domain-containing protein [Alphaproteobacteria bacterium]